MSDKDKSVEELKALLAKMEAEQVFVNEKAETLPGEIKVLQEKYNKARVKEMNAEGYLEDAQNYFEMVKGRKEQLVGIVETLKKEIESR